MLGAPFAKFKMYPKQKLSTRIVPIFYVSLLKLVFCLFVCFKGRSLKILSFVGDKKLLDIEWLLDNNIFMIQV